MRGLAQALGLMNPRIKKLWVEALRSGEYEQGTGVLCRRVGPNKRYWCCLGVLAYLWWKETWGGKTMDFFNDSWTLTETSGADNHTTLTTIVRDWAWLPHSDPEIAPNEDMAGFYHTATDCNDEHRLNFHQIADLIEQNL